jgi:glycosyltransferase involved in cell wall biosynthesis
MRITVAICTWNRAPRLRETLDGLCRLAVPPDVEWELLLVDNNSTDETRAVAEAYAARLPLRYLFQPRQGLSWARNLAVAQATGDVLLWTDDDVLVSTEWLAVYARAFAAWPDAAFFGGPIRPSFEVAPPSWVIRQLAHVEPAFALREVADGTRRLAPSEFPYGANYAVRTTRLGRDAFDVSLGRKGRELLSGEEVQLLERLVLAGHYGVWVADAPVWHFTPRERLTRRYVWDFFEGLGRTEARLSANAAWPTILGLPRWPMRELAVTTARGLWAATRPGSHWVRHYTRAARLVGMLREFPRARRERALLPEGATEPVSLPATREAT